MKNKTYFYLPSLLFLLLLLLPDPKLTILPRDDDTMPYRLEPYVDYLDTTKGSMGTFSTLTDSQIVFEYTLRKVNDDENTKPISGFTMMFLGNKKQRYLDAGGYDFLDIDVSMKEASSFVIYVKTFEHFTDTTNWVTQRYSETEVMLEPRTQSYRLPIKSFTTPNWWKSLIGPRFLTLPKEPDFRKVIAMDFQNNPGGALDIPERMEITKIQFRNDRRLLYGFAFGGFLLWIAGTALLLYRPFRVGDRLQIDAPTGTELGTVESLTLGYTVLQTFDKRRIVVPNSVMVSQITVNLTHSPLLTQIPINIDYTADIEQARHVLTELADAHPLVEAVVNCPVTQVDTTGVTLTLRVRCANIGDARQVEYDLYERAKERFDQERIERPSPYQTVVLKKEA